MGGGSSAPEVKETAAERALAEVSAQKWQDYQTQFVPIENKYMSEVTDLNTQSNRDRVAANASANVATQSAGQLGLMQNQMFSQNLDPTSGSFKTKSNALNNAIQKSQANAGLNARFGAENAYMQGVGNIVAMGNGQETAAMNSMGNLAQQASNQAIGDARNDFTKAQGDKQLVGSLVGAAGAYGMNSGMFKPDALNQGFVNSGLKYDTGFNSAQSNALAGQERGFGL